MCLRPSGLEWAPLSESAWSWWLLQSWKNPTIIRVTLLCGRVLSGRAHWRLLINLLCEACRQPPNMFALGRLAAPTWTCHVYLNSVQQMVSGGLAGEGLQTGFSRHGLPSQRAPLDMVYPLREHLNSVQQMVCGGYCEGLFPDTACWTRLRNTNTLEIMGRILT